MHRPPRKVAVERRTTTTTRSFVSAAAAAAPLTATPLEAWGRSRRCGASAARAEHMDSLRLASASSKSEKKKTGREKKKVSAQSARLFERDLKKTRINASHSLGQDGGNDSA